MKRRGWIALWFAAVLLLAWHGRLQAAREVRAGGRCALDGQALAALYQVDLMRDEQAVQSFCCLACARDWPDVRARDWWRVRDELTGEPLDAARAAFVASRVLTNAARRCNLHAFRDWTVAASHAAEYGGERVERPLVVPPDSSTPAEH